MSDLVGFSESVRRAAIRQRLATGTEIMSFDPGTGAGCGVEYGDPPSYNVNVSVKGNNKFTGYRKEDLDYHHLPGFGFEFQVVRVVSFPGGFSGDKVAGLRSEGFRSGPEDQSQVAAWLEVGRQTDFFETLDAVAGGNRFAPFDVVCDRSAIEGLPTRCYLLITAYVESDEVHAITANLSPVDVESMVASFIDVFVAETPKFHSLKPLYQDSDAEGTRLWKDEGLQSKAFYSAEKKLSRKLLGQILKILRKHRVSYQTTWGLGAAKYLFREYGLAALVLVPRVLSHLIKSFFSNDEEVRRQRLAVVKARDESRKKSVV